MAPIAEKNRRVFDAGEYDAMVAGARATIEAHVPPATMVAIVSRGDDALLALEGRLGAHFPQAADGAYAGHHPPDSEAAIAHLEELRASGVAYLAVPSSSFWWLDHYDAFAEHMHANYEEMADEECCKLYSLGVASMTGQDAPPAQGNLVRSERVKLLLEALLPSSCHVLIIGDGWRNLSLADRSIECIEDRAAAEMAAAGADRTVVEDIFVVLPLDDEAPEWVGELRVKLEARRPPLASRHPLVSVFELHPPIPNEPSNV